MRYSVNLHVWNSTLFTGRIISQTQRICFAPELDGLFHIRLCWSLSGPSRSKAKCSRDLRCLQVAVMWAEGWRDMIPCPHLRRGQIKVKLPRSQGIQLRDLQDSGRVSLDLPPWEESRRIFIQGESKRFMAKDWRVWEWFTMWGFQVLNRGTICQFWFQFYKVIFSED